MMKKNKMFQSNSQSKGNNNNVSNTTTNRTKNKQARGNDVGFDPSSDGSFQLDSDSEHSFELTDS